MYYVSSKRGRKFGITDTADNVEEFYTVEQIEQISQKLRIYGVTHKGIVVIDWFPSDFESLVQRFTRFMTQEGIDMGMERRIYKIQDQGYGKAFEVRFIMGMGNWYYGDDEDAYCEDICDADSLKREASKKLRAACLAFYQRYGLYPSYQLGEKGWCMFKFL